jgi:hypothetical protein
MLALSNTYLLDSIQMFPNVSICFHNELERVLCKNVLKTYNIIRKKN